MKSILFIKSLIDRNSSEKAMEVLRQCCKTVYIKDIFMVSIVSVSLFIGTRPRNCIFKLLLLLWSWPDLLLWHREKSAKEGCDTQKTEKPRDFQSHFSLYVSAHLPKAPQKCPISYNQRYVEVNWTLFQKMELLPVLFCWSSVLNYSIMFHSTVVINGSHESRHSGI